MCDAARTRDDKMGVSNSVLVDSWHLHGISFPRSVISPHVVSRYIRIL